MMGPKRRGKCYELAGRMILDTNGNVLLVHGAPWSHTHKIRIGHAWIEETEGIIHPNGMTFQVCTVIDLTQPSKRQKMPSPLYYYIGKMTDEHVTRYTKDEASKMMLHRENYGPWEGPAAAALGNPKRKRRRRDDS